MEFDKEQIRAIIYYNWKRGLTRAQCDEEMKTVLGTSAPHLATIKRWYNDFYHGRQTLEDEAKPGRPISATTDEMIEKIRELIVENPRLTTRQIAEQVKISTERVLNILHEK